MRNKVLAAAITLPLAFAAQNVAAATVSYTGQGSFSNITNCTDGYPACSIGSTGGGTNNQLSMSGSTSFFFGFPTGSPSTITDVRTTSSFVVPPSYTNQVIGELDWNNLATFDTDPNFNVNYTFGLSFTMPNNSSDTQLFSLNIQQTPNPSGDTVLNLSNATLAGLGPFNLSGVNVSNLHFALASGPGTYNGTTGDWTNPENSVSRLLIEADFTPTSTPEPMSLALLGTSLAGLGLLRRKRLG